MKAVLLSVLFSLASSQTSGPQTTALLKPSVEFNEAYYEVHVLSLPDNTVTISGNISIPGGAKGKICNIEFQFPVVLFHCPNCFFVPDSYVDMSVYRFTAPPYEQDPMEKYEFVADFILTDTTTIFGVVHCVAAPEQDYGISSLPPAHGQMKNTATFMKQSGFIITDVLVITFPEPVLNFTVNTRVHDTWVKDITTENFDDGSLLKVEIGKINNAPAGNNFNKQVNVEFMFAGKSFTPNKIAFEIQ